MWKPINDFENYEVNELGEVRNKTTGKILKASTSDSGYYDINLWKDQKGTRYKVHRLIALYFIDNPDNLLYVDHINGNKKDNRIENLRWCTKQQNEWNKKCKGYWKKRDKYVTSIRHNGKYIHLGTFLTPEEARQAYETKFIELRGGQYLR